MRLFSLLFISLTVFALVLSASRDGGSSSSSKATGAFWLEPLAVVEDDDAHIGGAESPDAAELTDSAEPAEPAAHAAPAEPAEPAEPSEPADEVDTLVAAPSLQPAAWAPPPGCCWFPAPATSASAALVLDEASATVLYEHEGHRRLVPASLTKVATAMVVLDSGISLDTPVVIDVDSRLMRGSSVMGIRPGDRFTVRDLLYGLMLPSGNDAALALGRAISGADEAFVHEMNALAERLGLHDTHFTNAHGLHNRDHYSSAYDLAMLSRYAMANPTFVEIAGAREWLALGPRPVLVRNVNLFLDYAGSDGVKTGFTNRAGRTMIASAVRDGRRIYVVLLNAPNRDADTWRLMDWAFNNSVPVDAGEPSVAALR